MRIFSDEFANKINNSNNIDFCYKITLFSGEKLYLTSSPTSILLSKNLYLPNSGLVINSINLNDSGEAIAEIEGIFEKQGITYEHILHNLKIEILITVDQTSYNDFFTFYCIEVNHDTVKFCLSLSSIGIKLYQTILKTYSKSCRANLGDKYCKINTDQYTKSYKVQNIQANDIIVIDCCPQAINYAYGKAVFSSQHKFNIVKHYNTPLMNNNSIIETSITIPEFLHNTSEIKLTMGCDKTFNNCIQKFNNAINFRGEPFIDTLKTFK
ncbi:DUF2163 domain-containing protein [Orientia tsutsugamushi]|uniref:Phage conserved hypothetical BR0599 family protein n=1 Tax=Orientia tsutsugamushi str. TA716 TaxID=1359175 RepID=A0A0F3P8P1_ORITS|nr:DUF2163 domain-containing protein [Orientia tsutsugamushi]KJV76700.1 phage conserved hypothetical BR0599 family protein [Orientia tsutsugamushi str. TA716]